jgi:hypothetical protein
MLAQPSKLTDVTLLTFIWKKPGSNLGRDTNYPDRAFSRFYLVLPDKCYDGAMIAILGLV